MRVRGFTTVCASATPAGTMASRSGNAIVAPAPRRTARLEIRFLVNTTTASPSKSVVAARRGRFRGRQTALRASRQLGRLAFADVARSERNALDDAHHDRGKPIIVRRTFANHL